jgi:hypothetical protein
MQIKNVLAEINRMQDDGVLDVDKLEIILARHGLMARWESFQKKFLGDAP